MECPRNLLEEIEYTLELILVNATELFNLSQGEFHAEKIAALQVEQEKLSESVQSYDNMMQARTGEKWLEKDKQKTKQLKDKIKEIRLLQDSFCSNMTVRKGLLQAEIEEINQAYHSLDSVHALYGGRKDKSLYTPIGKKQRVNALS